MKLQKSILALTLLLAAVTVKAQSTTPIPFVEVSGEASTELAPNQIEILITLSEEPSKGKFSIDFQEQQLASILKSSNIDAKKHLTLRSQSSTTQKRKDAYQYKSYMLTLSNVEELREFFDEAAQSNITDVRLYRAINNRTDAVRDSLRVEAIIKAKAKATTLADALGQSISSAIQVTDYSGGGDVYNYGSQPMMLRSSKSMADSAESIPTDLELEPIKISQSLTVRFKLEEAN